MKIGLIDVDGNNYPNLALMKLSAWHKAQGDEVEWWWGWSKYDRVYMSKVFDDTYSPDIPEPLNAYEDTGLEPEQVTKLMAAHRKAILELSKYRSSVLDALAALERYIGPKKPSAGSCQCREEAEAALKKREE